MSSKLVRQKREMNLDLSNWAGHHKDFLPENILKVIRIEVANTNRTEFEYHPWLYVWRKKSKFKKL